MKIGIDAKYYFTGTPSLVNVVSNLCDNIIEQSLGVEVVLFISTRDRYRLPELKKKIGKRTNISYQFIPGRFNFILNMLVYPLFLINKGFDVVLFQNYIPLWKDPKILYVNYIHDFLFLDYPAFFSKAQRFIFQYMLHSVCRADHTITISASERERILRHSKVSPLNVDFVYHGVNDEFREFSSQERDQVLNRYHLPKKYILYVGRLNRRKNIKVLLEAFATVEDNISLVIIGQNDYQEFELDKEILRLDIAKRVHKFEYVSHGDIEKIFSAATLFVFPSYAEGFGLPPLEAMRCGVPTIVSSGMAMPEICKDGAVYFEPTDSLQLSKKINFLLSDEDAYMAYKLNGKRIAEQYTWDKSAQKLLEILKNLQKK